MASEMQNINIIFIKADVCHSFAVNSEHLHGWQFVPSREQPVMSTKLCGSAPSREQTGLSIMLSTSQFT